MYSQCPDCLARFRVTADALRTARGTVRCGRCGSAFDALERLHDSIPPAAPDEVPPVPSVVAASAAAAAERGASTEYHFSVQDLESVFVEASDWHEEFPAPAGDEATEPPVLEREPASVVVDEGAPVEDITLEGERVGADAPAEEPPRQVDLDSTDELEILLHVPDSAYPEDDEEAQTERELESLAQQLQLAKQLQDEPLPAFGRPAAPVPATDAEPVAAPAGEPVPLGAQRWRRLADEDEAAPASKGSALRALGWTVGSLALALLLVAQAVHHFRQDLARHPQVGPPLRIVYERLGMALLPNWDLAAFELRQWGNDAATQGRMLVRASLTNRAGFAQPHPILRLELEDRFGATVATRDFEPADYLKNPSQAGRLLAPGASSEAELVLADPGREAVGYRLDVCLRESPALLRCARGPG
jgi:predicted Zn finger-like uncharacterized protein